ncbi:tyrosine-type recombinase/integrase [Nocardioidaceae bacterium SCSIO 66511]|nr:tyrosine-type recombinase/integrase [Nocardioidaceae bacterium SCSIO 66511]
MLPRPLRDELRAHRAEQARERLAAGPAWVGEHNLVFATEWGQVIDPVNDGQSWRRLLESAGVRKARVHDARHTAATLLLLEETDLRTVMAIMGWTELATAQRYTHAVDELRSRAAARMGSLLWSSAR